MTFAYRGGVLCAEEVSLEEIAQRFGTPCYIYSRAAIERNYGAFARALAGRPSLIAYSVKANSNLSVLALMARLGAGFDIVSGGELARVLAAGGEPAQNRLLRGRQDRAPRSTGRCEAGILCLNLESEAELERVDAIAARRGMRAPIAFRVNPDVDAKTHPYISTGLKQNKFGIAYERCRTPLPRRGASPQYRTDRHRLPYRLDDDRRSALTPPRPSASSPSSGASRRAGIRLSHIDLGGGIGIRYRDESPAPVADFVRGALAALGARKETLVVDPGRAIVGEAGVLLTRIEYVKPGESKNFVVVDAAMNDLIRPALYDAWHEVRPVRETELDAATGVYDIVGPVCESADFLARERTLAARPGGLLAVMSAGAYGMVMSSNYNTRPRPAEVMVSGAKAQLVRERESVDQLFAAERVLL